MEGMIHFHEYPSEHDAVLQMVVILRRPPLNWDGNVNQWAQMTGSDGVVTKWVEVAFSPFRFQNNSKLRVPWKVFVNKTHSLWLLKGKL